MAHCFDEAALNALFGGDAEFMSMSKLPPNVYLIYEHGLVDTNRKGPYKGLKQIRASMYPALPDLDEHGNFAFDKRHPIQTHINPEIFKNQLKWGEHPNPETVKNDEPLVMRFKGVLPSPTNPGQTFSSFKLLSLNKFKTKLAEAKKDMATYSVAPHLETVGVTAASENIPANQQELRQEMVLDAASGKKPASKRTRVE